MTDPTTGANDPFRLDPFRLDEVFALVGLPNPFAGVGRTVDQLRRGVDEMITTIERFNETLDQLNGVARRVNGFLDEIEEPVRVAMPQVTRTVRAADAITQQLSAPIERLAPGLSRLAEVLANPSFTRLPSEIAGVAESLGDLVRRLQPLTQVAETAGSMFGLRSLGSLLPRPDRPAPYGTAPDSAARSSTPATTSAKKVPGKKAPAKKAAAKKAVAKKAPAKKTPATKAAAKKAAPRSATVTDRYV